MGSNTKLNFTQAVEKRKLRFLKSIYYEIKMIQFLQRKMTLRQTNQIYLVNKLPEVRYRVQRSAFRESVWKMIIKEQQLLKAKKNKVVTKLEQLRILTCKWRNSRIKKICS